MPSSYFQFKQFRIDQDRCAMKVGTDGVLLGAWATPMHPPQKILDVGTGTGLVSLMMAQRFNTSKITAIEIDPDAARQAHENVCASKFAQRIEVIEADIMNWLPSAPPDFIVCNPPFFKHQLEAPGHARTLARHQKRFDLSQFLYHARIIIAPVGSMAIILPTGALSEAEYKLYNWYLARKMAIRPTPGKMAHRELLLLTTLHSETVTEPDLIIESSGRHNYSEEYKALTRDFYLHM
ncbi:MAG: methyltransferase domain-containing protein [Cryomorphaceae bacterium]|nr:MAG: methyltransferase domain-containing protein [Cryomorphaceae bacterium]